jgi:hypothetical protein
MTNADRNPFKVQTALHFKGISISIRHDFKQGEARTTSTSVDKGFSPTTMRCSSIPVYRLLLLARLPRCMQKRQSRLLSKTQRTCKSCSIALIVSSACTEVAVPIATACRPGCLSAQLLAAFSPDPAEIAWGRVNLEPHGVTLYTNYDHFDIGRQGLLAKNVQVLLNSLDCLFCMHRGSRASPCLNL